jgi:hypothetical protein
VQRPLRVLAQRGLRPRAVYGRFAEGISGRSAARCSSGCAGSAGAVIGGIETQTKHIKGQ